ncbi:MAG: hypothetical protein V3U15_04960, partial [Nitrospinota bacterium]
VNYFKDGIHNYRKCQWDKGKEAFKKTLALNPGDNLSQTYIDRCKHMKKNPPGDDWDGVWVMKSK